MTPANFLAIDLGASSGRVLLGKWDGARFTMTELHRFVNGPVNVRGHQHWDVLRLWSEIKEGLTRYAAQSKTPVSLGVDTWGVDFSLLDKQGKLLGNPYHYRDSRTDGAMERVLACVPRSRLYRQTGIQTMQINTLYQLESMLESGDPQLKTADALLMMPDLFNFWLSGRKAAEYTIASTSQMLDSRTRTWAAELLDDLGIPAEMLQPVVLPGAILGPLCSGVASETGLPGSSTVVTTSSHDTASAVAAVPGLDEHSVYIPRNPCRRAWGRLPASAWKAWR
jgi:rhamnulokinase